MNTEPKNHGSLGSLGGGANQSRVRDHNERLLLTTLHRCGALSGSDLARHTQLSPQTVSVILRKLRSDGLITSGEPQKGRVGKPSVPMTLAPDGAYSFGLKIGRRGADMLLMDISGQILQSRRVQYRYPKPDQVFEFAAGAVSVMSASMSPDARRRICGIGIARPFEIWKWHESLGAPGDELAEWKTVDCESRVAEFSDLPCLQGNDASAGCQAENTYGRGRALRDFAYFYVGSFVGGGVVLNHSVYEGRGGNAGAFGTLPSTDSRGNRVQLLDSASIHVLESDLARRGTDPATLWDFPPDWSAVGAPLEEWLDFTALKLAEATISVCSVFDFEVVLFEGAFPAPVRADLTGRIRRHLGMLDTRGIAPPRVEEASIGSNARAVGAACGPLISQFFLNTVSGVGSHL